MEDVLGIQSDPVSAHDNAFPVNDERGQGVLLEFLRRWSHGDPVELVDLARGSKVSGEKMPGRGIRATGLCVFSKDSWKISGGVGSHREENDICPPPPSRQERPLDFDQVRGDDRTDVNAVRVDKVEQNQPPSELAKLNALFTLIDQGEVRGLGPDDGEGGGLRVDHRADDEHDHQREHATTSAAFDLAGHTVASIRRGQDHAPPVRSAVAEVPSPSIFLRSDTAFKHEEGKLRRDFRLFETIPATENGKRDLIPSPGEPERGLMALR